MEATLFGYEVYHLLMWFWIYSFLGWAFECTYVAIHEGRFINRGFAFTPFCPIYGSGALLIICTLQRFADNLVLLFIASVIVTSLLEFIVYVILDKIFHQQWWDYSDLKFHWRGILSLDSSLAWGVLGVVLVKVLQPIVNLGTNLIPRGIGMKVAIGITVVYLLDFIWGCIKAVRRSESSKMIVLRVKTETLRQILLNFLRRKK